MNRLQWLLRSIPERKTRLHDLEGRMIGLGTLPYAPRVLIDEAARLFFDHRRPVPWISYRATRDLSRLIQPDWRVLEFGSGMSTIWFSRRAGSVVSIESDRVWYERVQALVKGHANVRALLRSTECPAYSDVSEWPDGFFDLLLVDGDCRPQCVERASPKVRSGGFIYLDNIDNDAECRAAAVALNAQSKSRRGLARDYTDFPPGSFAATTGRLVHFQ